MTSILDTLADNVTLKLRDEADHQPHTVAAVKNIEKVVKDEIRKGAFISEEQLKKMLDSLVINGQAGLFIHEDASIDVITYEDIVDIK